MMGAQAGSEKWANCRAPRPDRGSGDDAIDAKYAEDMMGKPLTGNTDQS
jgi:hypothetical protein